MKQRIKSFCVVELEVETGSVWSEDTTMAQIFKQSHNDAVGRLTKLFNDSITPDGKLSSERRGSEGIRFVGVKKIVTRCEEEA